MMAWSGSTGPSPVPDLETFDLILVALGVLAGATLQSATGFGFALVAGPAVFAAVEPAEAIAILFALGSVLNVLILREEDRPSQVNGGQLARVLAWSAPGIAAGILILLALSKPALQVIVGLCVIGAVAIHAAGGRTGERGSTPLAEAVAGFAAGTLTTTTGTAGPPLVLLLRSEGASREAFRDTITAMFLSLNVLGATALLVSGESVSLPSAAAFALFVALVILGRLAGRWVFERLDEERFRAVGLALIVVTALASITAGIAGA